MKPFHTFCSILLITFLFHTSAFSRDITWTGNGASPIWGDPANWDCNCVPGTDNQQIDNVTIGDGMTPVYVNFGYFNISINTLVLQNVELDLQLNLEVVDYTDVDAQSTIIIAYYSSDNYSILSTSTLYFYGTINVWYNNVPAESTYLDFFYYDDVETDCESIAVELGSGDGFTVEQVFFCEDFGDGVEFGPLEVSLVEYDNTSVSWSGNGNDNLWHNPENWNAFPDPRIPSINDVAIISDGDVVALSEISVKNLQLGPDCTLEINDGFESEFFTWVDEYASITWKGGDLSRFNTNQQNIIFNYGEIIIETSAVKNVTNGLGVSNNGQYARITIRDNVVLNTDGNNNTLRNQSGIISFEGDNQNIFFDEIINVGTIEKISGSGISKIKSGNGTFVNYNNVRCNSGILTLGDNFDNRGRISGNGSFDFEFASNTSETLSGGITPGNSPGALTIVRAIELISSTSFVMELQGTNPGTHYDQLIVTDNITIDGILNVQKPSWYTPQEGDQYKIITSTGNITGTFDHIVYPDMSDDWSISYNAKDIVVSFGASLPVELADLNVDSEEDGNLLKWTTLSEINSQDFIVEVSDNTMSWHEVGTLKCKGAASNGSNYHFLHRTNESNLFYYRLKMRDLDGTYEYSKIVSISRNIMNQGYSIFPNPATEIVNITVNQVQTWKGANAVVLNSTGQEIKRFILDRDSGKIDIKEFKTGLYFLLITEKNGLMTTNQFAKI